VDTDPDGDGVKNEMTRADVTALTVYQAVMAAPGRVIPNDPVIEKRRVEWRESFSNRLAAQAVMFRGCRWISGAGFFEEPNPYNPATNLRRGDAAVLAA